MQQATNVPQTPRPGLTAQDALILQRNELRGQLTELAQRRADLLAQRANSSSAAKVTEVEARMNVVDLRTAQLEQQLFAVNDQIAHGLAVQPATPSPQFTYAMPGQDLAVAAAISKAEDAVYEAVAASTMTLLSLFVAWQGFRRFVWKRKRPTLADNSAQLAQLQQSMDVIALEVERISEAQRYTAKLMTERGLGAGDAQPVGAPQRESVGARKRG